MFTYEKIFQKKYNLSRRIKKSKTGVFSSPKLPTDPKGHRGLAEVLVHLIESQIIAEKIPEFEEESRHLTGFAKITHKLRQAFRAKYQELKEIK